MALPSEFLVIVGSYVGVFLLSTFVFNFLMAGFLKTYLIVKGSRGAKVLVQVFTVSRTYYKAGYVDNGFLVYKDAKKNEKRLSIPEDINVFYRSLNVTCISVDEEKNTIILPSGKGVNGFDAEKMNNLYLRTLYRPEIQSPKEQLMFVLTIVNSLLALVTVGVLMFVVGKNIKIILYNTEIIKQHLVVLNTTIV